MQQKEAYWISSDGKVIPVDGLHIEVITRNLEKFGLSQKEVDELYDKYGEPKGSEGKAREEILIKVFDKGWIRLRYIARQDLWKAQLKNFNKRKKDYIWDFVNGSLEGKYGKAGKYTDLLVMDESGKVLFKGSFGQVQSSFLESEQKYKTEFSLIENYQDDLVLTETNLSRVWDHVNSNKTLAIMTAHRNEYTKQENKVRNKELANLVREAGYGFFWLNGYWIENQGKDNEVKVVEQSLFIIGNENDDKKLFALIQKWIKKYNQDAAVVKKSQDKNAFLIFQDGEMKPIGRLAPGKVAQAYSKLKNGRTFVFESAYTQGGLMAKWVSHYSQKSQTVLEKLDNAIGISYNEL